MSIVSFRCLFEGSVYGLDPRLTDPYQMKCRSPKIFIPFTRQQLIKSINQSINQC